MNNLHDKEYLTLLDEIFTRGKERPDRTGVGTRGVFGRQMTFDLRYSFPLLTSKRLSFHSIGWELLWMLRGETSVQWLQDRGVSIWNEWVKSDGTIGPGYGKQWRNFNGVDQMAELVKGLRGNPYGRRHLVSAWNPAELAEMALPPCHLLFQFHVQDAYLSCQIYQRSCDMFLGVPYNIASYALLTHIVGHICGLKPRKLVWVGGDCHIYQNHFQQVQLQLTRHSIPPSPGLVMDRNAPRELDADWHICNFDLVDYKPLPAIKAPVAV